jgi:transposase
LLPISPGTVTGGLKTLMPLFNPVCDAFNQQQMTENRFHNDESSWKVFEHVEEKMAGRVIIPNSNLQSPLKSFLYSS